jgi:tetratricopeptide (TPR) repeat protein
MNKAYLPAIENSASAGNASIISRDAIARRRTDIQKVQNILLIWLDNNIDNNDENCQNIITNLRHVVNSVNTFTDDNQCIQFIQSISNNKACMIISGSLGQHIVPRLHDMSQVDSIFIFCNNKRYHEQWAKEWAKIKGVFTNITSICETLKQVARECEHNAMPISFVASNQKMDQLDSSFMYTQILKEILLSIKFEDKHFEEYITYCSDIFADNENELTNVKQFKRNYRNKRPIYWYTCDIFLYSMLNSALRLMDGDIITRMGFFIGDLHRHIEQLHMQQYPDPLSAATFTVYRGQGLSKANFNRMTETKGGLLSFNNFLSTSKIRQVSRDFAERAASNPDLVGILFIMEINPSQSTTSFASISEGSHFENEDEILFSMHTVFRIQNIKPLSGNNRLFEINLTLTSDNDKQLQMLTDYIRKENSPDADGWFRLGSVLLKMAHFDKAEQIYETSLAQAVNTTEKAPIYDKLGQVKYSQGKHQEAITFYERSLTIYRKALPLNYTALANLYNNIGLVYFSMGDYVTALSSHEKALANRQQSLPLNHSGLAKSYHNIGLVNNRMGNYSQALSSHEKALAILKQSLPPNHPDLASSYNNIGLVYSNMGNYSKALSFYEQALAIKQQSLSPNHPSLANSYANIGLVYCNMREYLKALSYNEKAHEIQKQSLPPDHPDLASSYNSIGVMHQSMGNYSKARSFYERAIQIGQQKLSLNHPDLQGWRNNLKDVTKKL